MQKSSRILVLGASGMVGHAVMEKFIIEGFEVHGTYCRPGIDAFHKNLHQFSIFGDFQLLRKNTRKLLEKVKPHFIINCLLGRGNDFWLVNAIFPQILHELTPAHTIYISSNAVFKRSRDPWDESNIPSPETDYGFSKLFGENSASFIIRTSIVGLHLRTDNPQALLWKKNQRDCSWNGVTNRMLAEFIHQLIGLTSPRRTWHLTSAKQPWRKVVGWMHKAFKETSFSHKIHAIPLKSIQFIKSPPLLLNGYQVSPSIEQQIDDLIAKPTLLP